jgi:hypothetical protein
MFSEEAFPIPQSSVYESREDNVIFNDDDPLVWLSLNASSFSTIESTFFHIITTRSFDQTMRYYRDKNNGMKKVKTDQGTVT